MGTPIRHPLIDAIDERVVTIESRSSIVRLSPAMADLLARPLARGSSFELVTPETSRLTVGLRSALVAAGGTWLVSTASGRRDGLTGEMQDDANSGSTGASSVPTIDPEPLDTAAQLGVDVTVVHSEGTLLGGALEVIARAAGAGDARSWGTTEPLLYAWNRAALTEDARADGDAAQRYVVEGDGFSASITARTTARGVEETLAMTVDVPKRLGALDAAIRSVSKGLETLADAGAGAPTFALVLAREGERDRTFRPVSYPPPNPVLLLIGAGSVERLDLHETAFADEQDVVLVGAPSHPAFLLPLGDSSTSGWDALTDALESVGTERLTALVEPPLMSAWEDDLHHELEHDGTPHPHDGGAAAGGAHAS